MNKFQLKHKKLIEGSGGKVNGLFVEKVGVMLTKKPVLTKEVKQLFDLMNIDMLDTSDSEQHSEFNAKITYLSYSDEKKNAKLFNEKMIKEYGHRSVYNDEVITILVAGCSLETQKEFIAHNEATISRLTSSLTAAQNDTLYRLRVEGFSESFIDLQKNMINEIVKLRESSKEEFSKKEQEVFNILNTGNKVTSFTISMSVKDWHKIFIGRFSNSGVESEMIEILKDISSILSVEYPQFFNTIEEYFAMNNSKKYEEQ
jgi:hypothetical protein